MTRLYTFLIAIFKRDGLDIKPLGRWGYHYERTLIHKKYYD